VDLADSLPELPARRIDSHKGDFGRALVIGGARGMSGAITLAGLAALRSGAGLVFVAAPANLVPLIAAAEPSYQTISLPEDATGKLAKESYETLAEPLKKATAVGLGPGLGRSPALTELVVTLYREWPGPLVLDADALNALAEDSSMLTRHAGPRVLTPHPGEFARLLGCDTKTVQAQRAELARTFARNYEVVLVLKGARSIITDGVRLVENTTGNPGMATGGSGDVLTGITTAWLAQGLAPFEAARLAAHIHGLAGDLAADELGQVALIASDLVRYLPRAFRQLERPTPARPQS